MHQINFTTKEGVHNLPTYIVSRVADKVDRFVDLYCEYGFYVPEDLATDPGEWTNILRKIQEAFRLFELFTDGTLNPKSMDHAGLHQEMEEGFALFGKYFLHLIDYDRGAPPKH